ncbi:MAG TPA: Lrp/AsnC family transcriptional regulator [Patescibacteria group bacterium]|nr:Lrp/AsnC family transcriptional regulator [Patescibacteria group bacterium]
MKQPVLKNTDRIICKMLQENARIPLSAVAEKVDLSIPSVSEHVRKLEEAGVITGYTAKLNPLAFDYDITAFIFVTLESSIYYQNFIEQSRLHQEILECHAITGEASHLLKIRTKSMVSLEKLLSTVQQWDGVRRTLTNLVLSTHIETLALDTDAEALKK